MICVTSLTSYIFFFLLVFQGFTDDQLMLVEQNSVMVEEREREIRQIVQSISDLNEIFRDLAGMVLEQVKIGFKKIYQSCISQRLIQLESNFAPCNFLYYIA